MSKEEYAEYERKQEEEVRRLLEQATYDAAL